MKTEPHLRKNGEAIQLMVEGQSFFMLGGELRNSSASSLAYLESALAKVATLNANTVLAPIYWELLEPVEGQFDFALVDGLLDIVRLRGLKLVPLWFGTMKNATSCYVPEWVKRDGKRFPRAHTVPGRPSGTLSCLGAEAVQADARAFAALMRHIREVDADHTVIMVQVQNEPGLLGAARDLSPLAEVAFAGAVPHELTDYLYAHRDQLIPEFAQLWKAAGEARAGTWAQVFGEAADEVFMAWQVARFVETVAAAWRTEYDLPMFANAWLVHGPGYAPGMYPSGGPVSKMMDVWRAAAPHIDLLAPDIYDADFRSMCVDYARPGNPLFIPEARNFPAAASNVLYVLGQHAALGFSPFAIDDVPETHPLAATYAMLREALPVIADAQARGAIRGFVQQADSEQWEVDLDGYRIRARTNTKLDADAPGGALVMALGDDTFVAIGRRLNLTFESDVPVEIVFLETGRFDAGRWIPGRRLNGDETYHATAARLGHVLEAVRFKLHHLA